MSIDEVSEEDPPEDLSELDEDLDVDALIDEDTLIDDDTLSDDDDDEAIDDETDDETDEDDEALDELEAEELEMLTEDETSETLVVDEAAEMRAIRRAELAMDQQGAAEATEGEFVCSNCFLVLKSSQLANPRKRICKDCAA
jgi:hypothetical protein